MFFFFQLSISEFLSVQDWFGKNRASAVSTCPSKRFLCSSNSVCGKVLQKVIIERLSTDVQQARYMQKSFEHALHYRFRREAVEHHHQALIHREPVADYRVGHNSIRENCWLCKLQKRD